MQKKKKKKKKVIQEKETKNIHFGREELKLSLYAGDILYIENSKDLSQKLLEWIKKITQGSGIYKINIQKSAAFLWTNNEISERESKKKILFKIVSKNKIKMLDRGEERPVCQKL